MKKTTLILIFTLIFNLTPGLIKIKITAHPEKNKKIEFLRKGDYYWFKNSNVILRFDEKMACRIYYYTVKKIKLLKTSEIFTPSNFLSPDGELISDFKAKTYAIEKVNTPLRKGKKFTLIGETAEESKHKIQKKIDIELYENYPETIYF
ncbi:MAG: hypothetical protein HWN67_17490, partial [Candidatus Helarchaeota archaeon]|nr:hypothetical protein [Candidatus Helarchaeota archaeon]